MFAARVVPVVAPEVPEVVPAGVATVDPGFVPEVDPGFDPGAVPVTCRQADACDGRPPPLVVMIEIASNPAGGAGTEMSNGPASETPACASGTSA
jgi:hypothetical protein